MRIIHCSDLHLDADLRTKYDAAPAAERRAELLDTFRRLCRYAGEEAVSAVLICGDLFDTTSPSPLAVRTVEDLILGNSDILFFYLRGNHDERPVLFRARPKPDNLCLFGDDWTSWELSDGRDQGRRVCITGREPSAAAFTSPVLDPACLNIVMLHGQVREGYAAPEPESVPLSALRGRGIDYLALGHLHHYRSFALDERGSAAYCGSASCPSRSALSTVSTARSPAAAPIQKFTGGSPGSLRLPPHPAMISCVFHSQGSWNTAAVLTPPLL